VARQERVRILIFFDGAPPPGAGETERLGAVEVRYAAHADGAILAFLREAGRGWRVATDDRALGLAARATGAEVVGTANFWQKAEAVTQGGGWASARPGGGVEEETAYFADPAHRLPVEASRIARKRARVRRPK
jgi:hypothetical protein